MRIKIVKSPGPVSFQPRVFKEVGEEIADALVIMFQSTLALGVVPLNWKIANVTPLFRKGGREKPGNYRPFNLMSVVGKLLESVIKHLEKFELIRKSIDL